MEINLSKPSLFGEGRCLLCQIQNVFFVGIFDHKDNKTISRVDSNSDVEILLENDGFRGLVQAGIEIGMAIQSRNNRLNQKGKISKFHSLFLCYLSFFGADLLQLGDVGILPDGHFGDTLGSLGHALSDRTSNASKGY